jgi:photosystem II stability/assembly factor-like uncharacterized protein
MGRSARRLVGCLTLSALGAALTLPSDLTLPANAQDPARTTTNRTPGGVPGDFRGNSVTWLSAKQGWVLGAATCGTKTCSDVIGTTDEGSSWSLLGKVPAPITTVGEPDGAGVTDIRFVTSDVGWAFGPRLYLTRDGGASWKRVTIPGDGKQVLSLATSSSAGAYAVVSMCKYATGSCGQPLTFWRTTSLESGSWTQINVDLPSSFAADVAALGRSVYVIDELADGVSSDVLYASTDGKHFSTRQVPCNNSKDVGLIQAVPTSATDVAMLCDAPIGFGQAFKKVYRSTDTGHTYKSAGAMGMDGIQAQLAASPTGNLAVASFSDGSFIYVNDSGKTWTMPVGFGDGGAGWNDIVYTTNKQAWVVYSPTGFFHGPGQLYVTRDAGVSWNVAPY